MVTSLANGRKLKDDKLEENTKGEDGESKKEKEDAVAGEGVTSSS